MFQHELSLQIFLNFRTINTLHPNLLSQNVRINQPWCQTGLVPMVDKLRLSRPFEYLLSLVTLAMGANFIHFLVWIDRKDRNIEFDIFMEIIIKSDITFYKLWITKQQPILEARKIQVLFHLTTQTHNYASTKYITLEIYSGISFEFSMGQNVSWL